MKKNLEELFKIIEMWFLPRGQYIVPEAKKELKQLFTKALDKVASKRDKELRERIKDIPRIIINYKDGTKSKAILEHSLKTHGLLKQHKKDL